MATYAQVHGVDGKIARVFTTYGPHMKIFDNQLIPDFIINAIAGQDLVIYGDENFSTSLCYVSDVVDGLARLMGSDPGVKVVNLGGDEIVKMVDVANMIIKMTGSNSKVVFQPPLLFLTKKGAPDLTYVRDVLDWMPLMSLEDGLDRTVDYVQANKDILKLNDGE